MLRLGQRRSAIARELGCLACLLLLLVVMRTALSIALLSLLGLVACSNGASESESDEASGAAAMRTGSRLRSPLKVGIYDSAGAVLRVTTWLDRQYAFLDYSHRTCEGPVDVSGDTVTVSDDRTCAVTLRVDGDAVEANGDVQGRFVARRPGAIDGTWRAQRGAGESLELTGSTGADLAFDAKLTAGGATVSFRTRDFYAGMLQDVGGNYSATLARGEVDGCEVLFSVSRDSGEHSVFLSVPTKLDPACSRFQALFDGRFFLRTAAAR